jgi:poly(A) polymerase
MDDLEHRIAELAEEARRAAERPGLDGADVMAHLGIGPGRDVGRALAFLLEVKRTQGDLQRPDLEARLDAWWADQA